MNRINNYNPQFKGLSLSIYNKKARIAASELIANVTHQEAKLIQKPKNPGIKSCLMVI